MNKLHIDHDRLECVLNTLHKTPMEPKVTGSQAVLAQLGGLSVVIRVEKKDPQSDAIIQQLPVESTTGIVYQEGQNPFDGMSLEKKARWKQLILTEQTHGEISCTRATGALSSHIDALMQSYGYARCAGCGHWFDPDAELDTPPWENNHCPECTGAEFS